MKKGLVHIYYGDGKGKTTAAIGLGIRAAGRNLKVFMVQFLKTDDSGELNILKKIPNFSLGDAPKVLPFYFQMSLKEKEQYKKYADLLFNSAIKASVDYDVVIMDEVLDAVSLNIISLDELTAFIKSKPLDTELVITGHDAGDQILNLADYVSKVSAEKHPYTNGETARIGIEY